eukprot:3042284-Prymnesium_polylepis.1
MRTEQNESNRTLGSIGRRSKRRLWQLVRAVPRVPVERKAAVGIWQIDSQCAAGPSMLKGCVGGEGFWH